MTGHRLATALMAALGLFAQSAAPELVLLNRVKDRIRLDLRQLPNYTCLETVRRFHSGSRENAKWLPLDTVLMEIVYSGGQEWYGLPGGSGLSEKNPASFIGSGMIGDGLFAITLHNLFVSDAAFFTPQGKDSIDGRDAWKYDFRLPRSVNRFEISVPEGSGTVGEEGSFWVDPATLDLIRLDVRIVEAPSYLHLGSTGFTVKYARTRIGEFDTMLPEQAELHLVDGSGRMNYDRLDFTHCRTYHTASTIHFGEEPAQPQPGAPAQSNAEIKIPALLAVTIETTTPITDRDPVGKAIEGRVIGALKYKGRTVIDDGAAVRGRLRRLERYEDGKSYIVGLEFTEVQAHEGAARFYADLLTLEKRKEIHAALAEQLAAPHGGPTALDITLRELPGVASFFIDGSTFTLMPGFRTVWRTRGLLRGL